MLDIRAGIAKVPVFDMKNSPLTTVLLGLLTVSALASVVLCWLYISSTRQVRALQTQVNIINNNRTVMTALANDAIEYSKRNPAIDPILESIGLKAGKTPAPATPKPTTK
jgi:hypothetical protein